MKSVIIEFNHIFCSCNYQSFTTGFSLKFSSNQSCINQLIYFFYFFFFIYSSPTLVTLWIIYQYFQKGEKYSNNFTRRLTFNTPTKGERSASMNRRYCKHSITGTNCDHSVLSPFKNWLCAKYAILISSINTLGFVIVIDSVHFTIGN